MTDNVNLLKMPDETMRSLGRQYRGICRWQRKLGGRPDKIVRGNRVITFEQFVQDRQDAEMIKSWVQGKGDRVQGTAS